MAAALIQIDDTKDLGRQLVRAISLLRDGRETLTHALAHFTQAVDGDGSNISHFALPVSLGVFPSTTAAKASWDEIQSLNFVISSAETAINQACAKHGV